MGTIYQQFYFLSSACYLSILLMDETEGAVELVQTPSEMSFSRISQAKMVGFSRLYDSILFTTWGVATLGLEPPIIPGGRIVPAGPEGEELGKYCGPLEVDNAEDFLNKVDEASRSSTYQVVLPSLLCAAAGRAVPGRTGVQLRLQRRQLRAAAWRRAQLHRWPSAATAPAGGRGSTHRGCLEEREKGLII